AGAVLRDGGVRLVPSPLGDVSPGYSKWWLSTYSYVARADSRLLWYAPQGAEYQFTATNPDAGDWATPEATNRSGRERLQVLDSGYLAIAGTGERFLYQQSFDGGSDYLLSEVQTAGGVPVEILRYDVSSGCASGAGSPYVGSIAVTGGAVLRFSYDDLTAVDGGRQCVVRSIGYDLGGSPIPAATYGYSSASSAERPGLLAQVNLEYAVWEYEYDATYLRAIKDGALVLEHRYDAGRVVANVDSEESLSVAEVGAVACATGTDCCGGVPTRSTLTHLGRNAGAPVGPLPILSEHRDTLANSFFGGQEGAGARVYQVQHICDGGGCASGSELWDWTCGPGDFVPSLDGGTSGLWDVWSANDGGAVIANYAPAYFSAHKNQRDFWDVYDRAVDGGNLELKRLLEGAGERDGGGALRITSYGYVYGADGIQRVQTESRPSLLAGTVASTHRAYADGGRVTAEIREGHTYQFVSGARTLQEKFIGTFYFSTDALGRTTAVHGPCFVSSATATDCSGSGYPLEEFEYWSSTSGADAHKLRYHKKGPQGGTLLTTEYSNYDAWGNSGRVKDSAGVIEIRTYSPAGITSRIIDAGTPLVTSLSYDGSKLKSVQRPEGDYETYCHRWDAGSGCTGGVLTEKLWWKARSPNANGSSYWEMAAYAYWPDGMLKTEAFYASGGTLRRAKQYAADAYRRPTWESRGLNGEFPAVRVHDSEGNVIGQAPGANLAGVLCDGVSGAQKDQRP
ncbi:MAG: hypothetical protein H0U59_02990, partial [Gemmatimonadaceae bacterium]|nr:hypothetical protein [Gemmatimonadaceae bacterium]